MMYLSKEPTSKIPTSSHLVAQLDALLAETDGEDNTYYRQFNTIDQLNQVVVFYVADQPAACGAIKAFDEEAMEVKRMYTSPAYRGKGLATRVLAELEAWAVELGYPKCVLETGKRQPEAIALYEKRGYLRIPNYGQYIGIENSVCFEKVLK
jgi:putative acetyltransferase